MAQFSNLYQGFESVSPFAGWILAVGGGAITLVRRQWIFQDKAAIARERDSAVIDAGHYKLRAQAAEETVEALNRTIDHLRDTLSAEIESLRSDIKDLQHKTAVQTKFIRDLLAYNAGRTTTAPEIPDELKDLK